MNFLEFIKDNQIVLAGLGLSGTGILIFWLKDVPVKFFNLLIREFTTSLTMTSQDETYYNTLIYVEKTFPHKNFRRLKLSYGSRSVVTSIGYGYHIIKYMNRYLLINLQKEGENKTQYEKNILTIRKFGRSRKLFDNFIKNIALNGDINKIKTYTWLTDERWFKPDTIHKRNLSSVYIGIEKKELVLKALDKFLQSEKWYVDNGIPYQLGILLYGPPGTGKTSLIRAISSALNMPIYYISSKSMHEIERSFSYVSEKSIIVIEDIDTNDVVRSRDNTPPTVLNNSITNIANLSDILNCMDGIMSRHGNILICTTNHIDKLDQALFRPGRIDLKIEIGYINNEILEEFINKHFPGSKIDIKAVKIKSGVTVSDLQQMLLLDNSDIEIINKIEET